MKSVYPEVLKRIKPSLEEQRKFKRITASFLRTINTQLNNAKAILGGSGAKDTWLAGNHDVDIFVVFDYKKYASQSAALSDLLEPRLRKAFSERISRLHGSRDYFQLSYEGYHFEVVPILKIASANKALNITDISPFHARWVNKQAKQLKDEIRLAKQFCKGNSLYGAESYIAGFSGYVLEILVAYYSSFERLLKAAQSWEVKDVVDIAYYYPKKDALFHLNQSKLQSPLIVVDPVDKNRNAAAALSQEKFSLFKKKAKEFLSKKKKSFFEIKHVTPSQLEETAKKKKHNLVVLEIEPLPGKDDVVGAKLLKAHKFLEQRLLPFSVICSGWDWSDGKKAIFYFFLVKRELPHTEIRQGPPLAMKQFVSDFKKQYKKTIEQNGRITAEVGVEKPHLEDRISLLIKQKFFQEKIKKIISKKVI